MAQYRLSAQIIKRSKGRSAIAAAAYRAAESIYDERTGITHDYSRKAGVEHAQIMAPDNTPDWMLDRPRLWNAVEAAEKRKDAQLAREVLLNLPHELDRAQQIELVRGFVQEQYVGKGYIADFAIHRPDKKTDERNWHAHVMVTMRELTSDGFGPKFRPTKARIDELKAERQLWADHQNRMFERLNMPQRVNARSYEDRGIDRLPTVHLGPVAAAKEKKGERTRLGDRNREIMAENAAIAEAYRKQAENDNRKPPSPAPRPVDRRNVAPVFAYHADTSAKTKREKAWAQRDHERRMDLQRRLDLARIDLDHKLHPQVHTLEADQKLRNGRMKATMQAEIDAIDARMQAKGVTRFFRNLIGKTRRDTQERVLYVKTLDGIAKREAEERQALAADHQRQKMQLEDRYAKLRANLERKLAIEKGVRDGNLRLMPDDPKRPKPALERAQGRQTRQIERSPPKPEPVLQPARPRAAGRDRMPPTSKELYDRKVQDWAKTPEGRKATGIEPRARADFSNSAPEKKAEAPSPAPDPKPMREAWWNSAQPAAKPASERGNDRDNDRGRERE